MSTFLTSSRQKKAQKPSVFLHFLTSKCASRHNGVHFFRHFNTFWLGNVLRATTACTFSTSQLPKVVRTWCALCILTWKCASRHNGVHFFRHLNFQKVVRTPGLHFDLEMCFAPQRHALFRHRNFQKWSDHGVFLHILTSKMCFAPQRRAIFHRPCGQLAPHPPL